MIQVTFDQIGKFLHQRFQSFPEKIPLNKDISLWEGFGDKFRFWFEGNGYGVAPPDIACVNAVIRYINTGEC